MARLSWPPAAWLSLGLLLALVLLMGVRAAGALLAPPPALPPVAPAPAADPAILGRFDPFFRAAPADGAALPVTALPLMLRGIRFDASSGRGAAFIAGADGIERPIAPGEEVMEGVRLASLAPDHVVLDRAGARESLWLDAGGAAPAPAEPPALPAPGSVAGGTAVDPADDREPDIADPPPPQEDS